MPDYTLSPYMSLTLPTVGVQPGPTFANNINADLSLIDSHNHTEGQGVRIPPSGLDISADLDFQTHAALSLTKATFVPKSPQISSSSSLYMFGVDLYVNDANGNQIRLTQSGSIAGAAGSISGLSAPASASYVSGNATFVWQSDVLTPANMDGGSIIIREVLASANGITLSSPSSLAADYTLTLPATLPASNGSLLKVSSGGIMSNLVHGAASLLLKVNSGGTDIEYGQAATASIADSAITTAKIADTAVTIAKTTAATISGTSPITSTTSTAAPTVVGSFAMTCDGAHPVELWMEPSSAVGTSYLEIQNLGVSAQRVTARYGIGYGSTIYQSWVVDFYLAATGTGQDYIRLPLPGRMILNSVPAGSNTFEFSVWTGSATQNIKISNAYFQGKQLGI